MANSKPLDRLEASARKAEREREAAKAMREYDAERSRIDANTVRLRALRLEKEAADAKAAAMKQDSKAAGPAARKVRKPT